MKKCISFVAIITILMPMTGTAQAPNLARIGAAGAVSGRVDGFLEGAASGKVVESGQSLFANEKISTDTQGRLQVLLKDETVFTIGPNSSIVLDKFVYTPGNESGTISVAVKGLFRFVTGKIARRKPSEMTVRMPVGVIGIRGTMVVGNATPNGSTVVLLGPGAGNNAGERIGQAKISSNGKSVSLLQPGSAVNIGKDGGLGPVFKISADKLNALLSSLGSHTSGSGGGAGKVHFQDLSSSKASGQDTAKGLGNANDTRSDLAAFQSANQLLNTINGTQLIDGTATWDQVRTVSGGRAMYTGSGVFNQTMCSNGPCSVQGPMSFNLAIDFGARTIGGVGSTVSFNTSSGISENGQQIAANFGGTPISFGSLTGAAVFTPTIGTGLCTGCTGSGAILNKNGVAAGGAQLTVQFNNGSLAGSGTVVGTR